MNRQAHALDTEVIKEAFNPVAKQEEMIVAAGVTSKSNAARSRRGRSCGGLVIVTVVVVVGWIVVSATLPRLVRMTVMVLHYASAGVIEPQGLLTCGQRLLQLLSSGQFRGTNCRMGTNRRYTFEKKASNHHRHTIAVPQDRSRSGKLPAQDHVGSGRGGGPQEQLF